MRNYKLLILFVLLGAVGLGYGGLFYVQHRLSGRDFSAIQDPTVRAGYCMAATLTPPERDQLAESLARPPDNSLYLRLMPYTLAGEVTPAKSAASRALLEREALRARTLNALRRVAERCHYDRGGWEAGDTPLSVSVKWLQKDPAFVAQLQAARARPADAALRLEQALIAGELKRGGSGAE
jgi:hypothetical protein